MARRMATAEPESSGTMRQNDKEHANQPPPASKQLSTRCCARCSGLLVNEWYYDLHNTGQHHIESLRCVQCGHRVDPVILQNQIQPPVERQTERLARPRYSMRTGLLGELT
ncbi:MAG: hypothetical protein ABI684_13315 [Nitrospirota bacterium]